MQNDTTRSLVSLAIILHLFCVFVGLFGNQSISTLQQRVQMVLTPYCRLLNLDPQFTAGFHLTHAMQFEDDHQFAVQLPGEPEAMVLPAGAIGPDLESLGFRRQRWRTLTQRTGLLAADGDDQAVAEVARALGETLFPQLDTRRFQFQIRRFQPPDLLGTAEVPEVFEESYETIYRADVLLDSAGKVRVHKQVEAAEAAQVRETTRETGR
jgi:hypothetical protein